MEFFADGGFQQLFCDLNDQQNFVIWDKPLNSCNYAANSSSSSSNSNNKNNNIIYKSYETSCSSIREESSQDDFQDNCLRYDPDHYATPPKLCKDTSTDPSLHNDQFLQNSLDYLLSTCAADSMGDSCDSPSHTTPLTVIAQDLSDWEDKFLDNYIEIPELVDILPEKTPFCTDNCYHFLQETAQNLKLFSSAPSSPSPCKSSTENAKENDKSYPCDFGDCRKIYAKPAHLKAHLRRHLGEKPYICNWPDCTWRFSRSDELSRHRRSHSGVKPYKCDFCAKCFARSDHLTKHRKVHERRLQAARKAGKAINGEVPQSVLTVRPGRKRKNQF